MIAAFIQVLRKLSCFATTCLTDDDHDAVITNRCQQLFFYTKYWQVFTLLFQSLVFGKLADCFLLLCNGVSVSVVGFVIDIFARWYALLFV